MVNLEGFNRWKIMLEIQISYLSLFRLDSEEINSSIVKVVQ